MNECESPSCYISKVPDNTSRKKQLKSKAKCNDANVPPQAMVMPNPCRKRGRPKKSIENGKTESDVVNLRQSNRPNVCSVPDEVCDITPNVLSNVSRFGRVRKAMRVLNYQ